jgi:YesN/AraC family two-component response regulator
VNNSLIKEKLKNFNIQYSHPSYSFERKLLREIKLCLLDEALATLHQINSLERPTLSNDRIRSCKNSLIASCTLFTRAAIDSGVDYEDAFATSDIFIKHIEHLNTENELTQFEFQMVVDFIELIERDRISEYQYPISKVVKYVYANASKKLSVSSLAELYNMSPDYLSKRFHQEVGVPLSEFIQAQKIEIAKNFLEFSKLTITDISTILEYCNPAHFTKVFKKHTNLSPNAYRHVYMNREL